MSGNAHGTSRWLPVPEGMMAKVKLERLHPGANFVVGTDGLKGLIAVVIEGKGVGTLRASPGYMRELAAALVEVAEFMEPGGIPRWRTSMADRGTGHGNSLWVPLPSGELYSVALASPEPGAHLVIGANRGDGLFAVVVDGKGVGTVKASAEYLRSLAGHLMAVAEAMEPRVVN